jgi:hypothetical protein
MTRLQVKPTAGGQKIDVETDLGRTVLELKEELAPICSIPAKEQRLVWRGQILKDERTLDSYGGVGGRDRLPLQPRCGAHSAALAAMVASFAARCAQPRRSRMRTAGIAEDHVLHLVRGKPAGNIQG